MSAGAGSPLADARALVADFAAFSGRRLAHAVMLMLAGGALEGVGLAFLVPIFALVAPQAGGRWAGIVSHALLAIGVTTRTGQLGLVLGAFCALVGIRAVTLAARDRLLSDLALGFVDHQRLKVIRSLAHAPWQSLARLQHARIAHILSSEIGRLASACSTMMQIAVACIMLAVQATLMILLSPAVASLAIGFSLLGLFAIVPSSRRAASVGKSTSRISFRMAGYTAQFMGGLKLAIAHDMADAFVADIAAQSEALRAQQDDQVRFQSRLSIASASVAAIVGAALMFGSQLLSISPVKLFAALVILSRMSGPVRSLQQSAQQLFGVVAAFDALQALYADLGPPTRPSAPSHARAEPEGAEGTGAIRFERVGFAYPGSPTPVFADFDLTIEPGEVLGLVGPSGAGKTTFLDLLTGLLEPQSGTIRIGERVVDSGSVAAWRRRLAYVAQDSYLANSSIRANLSWTTDELPEASLWRALGQAGAADLVAGMPQGLDTIVDERGTRLSGGERQRIALARAILRRPALLILDEATNAIDIATERVVIDGIRGALPSATILVVAHRAETLAACDRIVSLGPASEP